MLGGGSLANDAVLGEQEGQWTVQGDLTDAAFLVAERKLGITSSAEPASGAWATCRSPLSASQPLTAG